MFLTVGSLDIDPVPDFWVVKAPLVWCDAAYGRLEVPVGFRTDLASIPRVFRNLPFLDPCGLSRRPAIMHDWLYAERSQGKGFADCFLERALEMEGVTARAASTYYYGVHWFGGSSWASDAGALETRDFDTPDHFTAWKISRLPPGSRYPHSQP